MAEKSNLTRTHQTPKANWKWDYSELFTGLTQCDYSYALLQKYAFVWLHSAAPDTAKNVFK